MELIVFKTYTKNCHILTRIVLIDVNYLENIINKKIINNRFGEVKKGKTKNPIMYSHVTLLHD
jgi:hypothetical protein